MLNASAFPDPPRELPRGRGVFCNRTLNFRALRAIGYDMDYTLVGYRADVFERRVYEMVLESFLAEGWPVEELVFDPEMVARGLIIDTELGNLVKANRFGFIKRAMHGTQALDFATQRDVYTHVLVDLAEDRWVFLNTLFSLSEGCLYAQMVELLDQGKLPKVRGYEELYRRVRAKVDAQHLEGKLKAEIAAAPERFVVLDSEAALALLDQRTAGKKLVLITNSEWSFTQRMMTFAYDPFLPGGMTWRQLFDLVIVSARKPDFFTERALFFEIVTDDGLLRPLVGPLQPGRAYLGGCAAQVEQDLGISGEQILYVGDHMFGDGREPFSGILSRNPFREAYQQRLAELRDLLLNPDQLGRLIDEHAAMIWNGDAKLSLADADRAKWDYHPIMSSGAVMSGKSDPGLFYFGKTANRFGVMPALMKDYVQRRQRHLDRLLVGYTPSPAPQLTGPPEVALATGELALAAKLADPAGAGKLQWRLAEVTDSKSPAFQSWLCGLPWRRWRRARTAASRARP